jgi:quercetin dioxygenase-like cupin family protein
MGWLSRVRRLVVTLLASCAVWAGSSSHQAGAHHGRSEEQQVYVANADDLEWRSKAIPQGASWAEVYSRRQALVRWPSGAGLPMHVRHGSWHGVVISGDLVLRVSGHAEARLGPLSYFFVLQGTRLSAECRSDKPCVYVVFDTQAESIEDVDTTAATADERPTGATDSRNPGFEMIDLAAARWRRVPNALGARRARGQATSLQARLNVVFPYALERGSSLPPAVDRTDTAAFILSGVLLLRVGKGPEHRLGPGSFFRIPGGFTFSNSCTDQRCLILSTDPPADWEGARYRPMFPS